MWDKITFQFLSHGKKMTMILILHVINSPANDRVKQRIKNNYLIIDEISPVKTNGKCNMGCDDFPISAVRYIIIFTQTC